MEFDIEKYRIKLFIDSTFSDKSVDNLNQYDFVYFEPSEFVFPTVIGINIFQGELKVKSAVIGSIGGGSGIHETSIIKEDDRILICCSDSVFCLSIPDLKLLWKTQADQATCFEIFKYRTGYIIHGELEISRLENNGKVLWQQVGADIFTTPEGNDDFSITNECIIAKDWERRVYKFDFNGKIIS